MDELIKQAEEAFAAEQAAKEADALVTAKNGERELAIFNAEQSVNAAEGALQKAIEDRHTAQVFAIEQLSEANAALLNFVKGQQASTETSSTSPTTTE